MSGVRVLVGTRKGAFVLTSDGQREELGDQRPPLRGLGDLSPQGFARRSEPALCVAVQRLVRPDDPALQRRRQDMGAGGEQVRVRGRPGTHQWYDGTPHPWEFKRVWHLEPSLTDPDTVYAGVEDAALFRSTDGGQNWQELPGCAATAPGRAGSRAPGGCACTRSCWTRAIPSRIFIAISAAGAFRTDDGGETWRPINRGLKSEYIPDPNAEVGHCVHRIAMHPLAAERAFHAEALGRHAQRRCRRFMAGGQRQLCRPTSASRSTFTRTSRKRFMSCRSRATRNIFRSTASCAIPQQDGR